MGELAADLKRRLTGKLPEGWQNKLPVYKPTDGAMASRKLSEAVLEAIHDTVPELMSGSADLTGSNNTRWKSAVDFQPPSTGIGEWSGRYMRYGVREHAMAGMMNGMAAYGTVIPAGGTFLNFMSYAAGSVRLSALSHHRVIYVATHDSIGLSEDGPTHQPIEKGIKGGYVALETEGAQITLVSTGSEVSLCLEAVKFLAENKGIKARVVSMPCMEVFDAQSKDYKLSVIPDGIPSLSVEVMSTLGWEKYSHEQFGLNRFGASGPYKDVYKKFEFMPEGVAKRAVATVDFYKDVKPLRSPLNRAFQQLI